MSGLRARRTRVDERDRIAVRESLRTALRYDPAEEAWRKPEPSEEPRPRVALVFVLTLLCIGAAAATLLAVSFAQVTSRSVAIAAHERTLAALTEIDALIAIRATDVQQQLDAGQERVTLPDFAVEASAARGDAATADGELDVARFRTALLSDGAARIYEGPGAAEEVGGGDVVLRTLRRLLTAAGHSAALSASAFAGAGTVLAGSLLLLLAARRRGWIALGTGIAAAGLGVTIAAGVASAALGAPGGETAGTLRAEELAVARALLEVPYRNGVVSMCLGGFVAAIGVARFMSGARRTKGALSGIRRGHL